MLESHQGAVGSRNMEALMCGSHTEVTPKTHQRKVRGCVGVLGEEGQSHSEEWRRRVWFWFYFILMLTLIDCTITEES
jgi:hypothetical protein